MAEQLGHPICTKSGIVDNANNITDNGIYNLYKYPSTETNDTPKEGYTFALISFKVFDGLNLQIAVMRGEGNPMYYRLKVESVQWRDINWMKIAQA